MKRSEAEERNFKREVAIQNFWKKPQNVVICFVVVVIIILIIIAIPDIIAKSKRAKFSSESEMINTLKGVWCECSDNGKISHMFNFFLTFDENGRGMLTSSNDEGYIDLSRENNVSEYSYSVDCNNSLIVFEYNRSGEKDEYDIIKVNDNIYVHQLSLERVYRKISEDPDYILNHRTPV